MSRLQDDAMSPKVILLDVYETLLDMSDVERRANSLFDSSKGYSLWFELLMQYCFVDNCTGQFHDFTSIAAATMQMTAKRLGKTITSYQIDDLLELLRQLPVREGVPEGLSALNDHGFRVAALTNTPEATVCDRMERTGLISYFENVFSAETVKKYKPCREVYEWAMAKMNVNKEEVLVVSSHEWDIAGANAAGIRTAYLVHSGNELSSLVPTPDLFAASLFELVSQLLPDGKDVLNKK